MFDDSSLCCFFISKRFALAWAFPITADHLVFILTTPEITTAKLTTVNVFKIFTMKIMIIVALIMIVVSLFFLNVDNLCWFYVPCLWHLPSPPPPGPFVHCLHLASSLNCLFKLASSASCCFCTSSSGYCCCSSCCCFCSYSIPAFKISSSSISDISFSCSLYRGSLKFADGTLRQKYQSIGFTLGRSDSQALQQHSNVLFCLTSANV